MFNCLIDESHESQLQFYYSVLFIKLHNKN